MKNVKRQIIAMMLAISTLASARANQQAYTWWEGENYARTGFVGAENAPPPAHKVAQKEKLSGGAWLNVHQKKGAPYLEYDITVPEFGTYNLFVRKFWSHGPFRWRFDTGEWHELSKDVALLDRVPLEKGGVANWIHCGEVELTKGPHIFRLESSDTKSSLNIDCFALVSGPFFPRSQLKPDEPWPRVQGGWFIGADYDTIFDESPIDLRSLNESHAGANGRVTIKGDHFVQNGKPIRFIASHASRRVMALPKSIQENQARFLARKGFNLVRCNGRTIIVNGPNVGDVDEKRLDDLFRYIACLKNEGIYVHLCMYYQHWMDFSQSKRLAGYKKGQKPFAVHFFNQEWRDMCLDWWRAMLDRVNPYTGTKLKDDPCVMGLELLNEDSLFFFTFSYKHIPAEQMAILEKQFGDWLIKKYGSLDKALSTWNSRNKHDRPEEGRVGFVHVSKLGKGKGIGPRERDTARFMAETQRRFFDEMKRTIQEEIGYKGLFVASNWRTAKGSTLGPIERWTNAGCDIMDHHGYYPNFKRRGNKKKGIAPAFANRSLAAWQGHPDKSDLSLKLPFLDWTVNGKPGFVTEYAWSGWQNACRAEMPLISSALAAQSGIDALFPFAITPHSAWMPSLENSWPVLSPTDIGQFPAMALSYRLGKIKPGKVVAELNLNQDDIFKLNPTLYFDTSHGDGNRGEVTSESSHGQIQADHFAAGQVLLNINDQKSTHTIADISQYHDAENKVIKGSGGQIEWPYGRGLFMVKAPGSQGIAGHLGKAGKVELPDLTVEMKIPFGCVWAVAMDDQPLATSNKILLQVMSEQKNHGFETDDSGPWRVVTGNGEAPVIVRNLDGSVSFKGAAANLEVTALDINGVPIRKLNTAANIQLLPNAVYYLLSK